MSKILAIGDWHAKRFLSYSDYLSDRRINERQEIIDFIIKASEDCDTVVLMGDNFDVPNPPSDVIRDFTNFLERFGDKKIYIISGNHEVTSDGRSACDYLSEIKGKNWEVINNEVKVFNDMTFLPYITNSFLEVENNDAARDKIMSMLTPNKFLFLHHTVSNVFISSHVSTNDLPEVVLPQEKLSEMFKLVTLGHIHRHSQFENVLLTGSIFPASVNEDIKYVFKIEADTCEIEKIPLPGRRIVKLEDPTDVDFAKIKPSSIVKVVLTKKLTSVDLEKLKDKLRSLFSENGAYILIDQSKVVRDRVDYKDSILDFSMDKLLELYSREKEVDLEKLKQGFELIK